MADLVRVRSAKGKRTQFLISRGLFEKYPDHYVAVDEPSKAVAKNDRPVSEAPVNVGDTKK